MRNNKTINNAKHDSAYRAFRRTYTGARNIAVDFTVGFFATLREQENCHYCSSKLSGPVRSPYAEAIPGCARMVDRKDKQLGHTEDNSFACCAACYFTRGKHMIYELMLVLGAARQGSADKAVRLMKENERALHNWKCAPDKETKSC